jgi:hypothetical protein
MVKAHSDGENLNQDWLQGADKVALLITACITVGSILLLATSLPPPDPIVMMSRTTT